LILTLGKACIPINWWIREKVPVIMAGRVSDLAQGVLTIDPTLRSNELTKSRSADFIRVISKDANSGEDTEDEDYPV